MRVGAQDHVRIRHFSPGSAASVAFGLQERIDTGQRKTRCRGTLSRIRNVPATTARANRRPLHRFRESDRSFQLSARRRPFQTIANRRPLISLLPGLFDRDPVPALSVGVMQTFVEHCRVLARIDGHLDADSSPTRRHLPSLHQNQRSLRAVVPGVQARRGMSTFGDRPQQPNRPNDSFDLLSSSPCPVSTILHRFRPEKERWIRSPP